MTITDRSTVRLTVVSAAQSALAGLVPSGNVLGNLPGAFAGASPLVLVLSSGSGRPMETYGELEPRIYLDIRSYVLLSTPDGTWTKVDAEARLDAIEAGIARLILANHSAALWHTFGYAGRSKVEDVMTIDGFVYRRETIPVELRLKSDT